MQHPSLKMWTALLIWMQIWTLANAQGDSDFKHELPPGVELVNPKDFGLTDDQLGGLLSNVKVLGGSQIGDTKTQILTVGFDGDEDLNFDDFEIPGLTDKKTSQEKPDKDKQIANVAFEKFKEFFKDPKKSSKSYEPNKPKVHQPQTPEPEQRSRNNNQIPQQQQYHTQVNHQLVRPSPDALQQHYPVTLTQQHPTTSRTAPPPVQIHIQHQQQPPRRQQATQQQQQQYNNPNSNSQPPRNNNPQNQDAKNYQSQSAPPQQPLRQSSHPIAFANNNQPSQVEFGARLTTPPTPLPQLTYTTIPQFLPPPQQQANHQHQHHHHKQPSASAFQNQVTTSEVKIPATQSTPPGNFQRFTIYPQKYAQAPTSHSQPPSTSTSNSQSVGQVVRNQLLFNPNSNQNTQRPPEPQRTSQVPQKHPQEYRTIDQAQFPHPPALSIQNPASSSSSSIPSLLKRFPEDPLQRPVSHIFIQHQNHVSPVQQTSFHPRFVPPTKFVNNFTPSVNRITTTPIPHFEVTPSMPMILISTNENAITDPKRMELLRHQQKQMEDKRKLHENKQNEHRQPHSLHFKQQSTQSPYRNSANSFNQNEIPEEPRKYYQFYTPQDSYNQDNQNNQNNQFKQQSQENNNNNYQQHHQNSFNFQTQQQQHQLHAIQNTFFNNNQGTSSLPPRPYYQQQSQPSTNYQVQQYPPAPLGIQPPPPPHTRFQRPESGQYYGTRHKRGYRHRLQSILRGLWGDRD